MNLHLDYDEAVALLAVLEAVDSESTDYIARRLKAKVHDAWKMGSMLTPMFTPFIIAIAGEQGTRKVIRETLCDGYSPSYVEVVTESGERLNLEAKRFKWRYL